MKDLKRYECDGQMGLFDYIEPNTTTFCWDNDINEILDKLKEVSESHGLEIGKTEFKIWDHVPYLGYRLWLEVKGTRTELYREDFKSDVVKLVADAKQRNVELTPMWGACMFFGRTENEKGSLSFTTMFMDKTRQRIKSR